MTGSMLPSPRVLARAALLAAALTGALAACGRRGPLEMPPDPNAPKQQEQTGPQTPTLTPVPTQQPRRNTGIVVPNRPFILDKIL